METEEEPVEIQTFDEPEFNTEVGDLNTAGEGDEPTADIPQIPEETAPVEPEEAPVAPQVTPAPAQVATEPATPVQPTPKSQVITGPARPGPGKNAEISTHQLPDMYANAKAAQPPQGEP